MHFDLSISSLYNVLITLDVSHDSGAVILEVENPGWYLSVNSPVSDCVEVTTGPGRPNQWEDMVVVVGVMNELDRRDVGCAL
jgi:hypothetical protein